MGRNTPVILTAAPVQYLLITVEEIMFEKLAFSDIQNPKTVC